MLKFQAYYELYAFLIIANSILNEKTFKYQLIQIKSFDLSLLIKISFWKIKNFKRPRSKSETKQKLGFYSLK